MTPEQEQAGVKAEAAAEQAAAGAADARTDTDTQIDPTTPADGVASGEALEDLPEEDPASAVESDIAAELSKADEYLALAQRTQADFENYRKRATREAASAETRGVSKLVRELLPALDHLALALANAPATDEDFARGVALVQEELRGALAKLGVEAYYPEGERFDPQHHEAIAQQPAPEGVEPGSVLEVYQAGYRMNGTVLRPARVVVAQ
jgi:molecular chaperone GrpE